LFTSDVDAFDSSVRLLATHPLERGAFRVGFDTRSRFDLSATETVEQYDATGQLIGTLQQTSIEDARETDVGLFAEVERDLGAGRQSISAGLRGTYITTRNSGGLFGSRSTSESTPSGFVAYTVRPVPHWSTVVQVARGFREPALSDRYFAGITGRGFVEGNPDLEPETSLQLDLSAQRTGAMSRIGIFAYLYRIENLIERFRDTDDVFRFRNRGEQEIRGVEVEWDVDWGSALAARFTGTWVRGEILDDGSDPNDIPAPSIKGAVYGQPWERLSWRGAYSYFFRDDHPGSTEAVRPSYGVLDASVGFAVRPGFEVRLVLGNLLDEAYPASADDDTVIAPGRSTVLLLSGTF
jgi:iron complex outermembrane receptor protein